jgi:adenosylcobinamide-GDP ribazoletransferase
MPRRLADNGIVPKDCGTAQLTETRRRPRQDNHSLPPPRSAAWRLSDDVVMGLRLFSRLPTGDRPFEAPSLNRIAPALPLTSLVVGLGPALLTAIGCWLTMPSYFAAALGVAAVIVVSGAMAEDAIADAADGLFGGTTPARRLEIMKDSRHGTYGVAALCLYVVLRITAIGGVAAENAVAAAGLWLAAMVIARSGALWLSLALPLARSSGAAAAAGRVGRGAFWTGAGLAILIAFVCAAPFAGVLGVALALVAAAGMAVGWTALCRRLVGGQTGDLIGALQALIEIAMLVVLMMFS